MEDKILAALLDLRIALGKLESSMSDVDQAVRKLMMVEMEALELKPRAVAAGTPEDKKEDSALGGGADPPSLP